MTFNVEAAVEGVACVAAEVRENEPDVLFLQEARETTPGTGRDPVVALSSSLAGWRSIRGVRTRELVIMARAGTLEKVDEISLGAGRCALVGRLRLGGRTVRLIDLHLNVSTGGRALFSSGWGFRDYLVHTAEVRRAQLAVLLSVLEASSEPTILAGDFNSTPVSEISEALRTRLEDTFDAAGFGFGWTFSSRRPLWRIDYIYASRELRAVRSFVPWTDASDHLPLISDLAW